MDGHDFSDDDSGHDGLQSDHSSLSGSEYGPPAQSGDSVDNPDSRVSADPSSQNHHQNLFQLRFHDLQETVPYEKFSAGLGKDPISQHELGKMYGEPDQDGPLWHLQEYPDTCAIVSQQYVLESMTGHHFAESELVREAMKNGYYHPGCGTLPYDVGRLLEDYGIKVERSEFNNIDDIKQKLAHHQKIIVAIDSNEIWANSLEQQLIDIIFLPEANHAVTVIGYDEETDQVIVNDPGHPKGREMRVDLNDFEDAWQDSNYFMVSTLDSSPTGQA